MDERASFTVTSGKDLVEVFATRKVRVRDSAQGEIGAATISLGLPIYAPDVPNANRASGARARSRTAC